MSISFDVFIPAIHTENNLPLLLQVTEDYEGDKYHVVVMEESEHYDTLGFDTGDQLLKYIRELSPKCQTHVLYP